MNKDIKIIIAAHKKYDMPSDKMYIPVQVGSEGKDRKSTRLNSSHYQQSRMPSSA